MAMNDRGWDLEARWAEALLAAGFLTRFPLPATTHESGSLARAGWAFPLVGLVVGAAGGAVFALADRLGLPMLACGLLAVATTLLVTGALHEDGLADSADGLGARDSETALAIMRDSRIGAFGVLALILSVGLRVSALTGIADRALVFQALIAAHAVSRGLLPAVMLWLDPARADGLGAEAGRPTPPVATAAAAIALVLAVLALGFGRGLLASLIAAAAAALVAHLARRRLGGYTGDVLGAIQQVGEVVMLLCAAS
jgi:adenosylcobinamide-GDP ribazoletransferase